jgi:hypothetical protein
MNEEITALLNEIKPNYNSDDYEEIYKFFNDFLNTHYSSKADFNFWIDGLLTQEVAE